jgi:predicted DNA-binding transcriptional regulator YafY
MDGYKTNISNLHCDDVISLFLSGIGIHPDEQSEASINLKNALVKLEKSLPPQYQPDIRTARDRFYFDPTPWWKEKKLFPHLDALRKSIWQNMKIQIEYQKVNDEFTIRTIHPYGLVVKAMEWYLVGYCESKRDIRIFKCERIQNVNLLDETFIVPQDFSLEKFWNESARGFERERISAEHFPVDIRLEKINEHNLKKFSVIEKSPKDDFIIVTINLHSPEIAKNEIMDLIGWAEIIQPLELREFACHRLESMLKMYM